jgi:hypothetical protein
MAAEKDAPDTNPKPTLPPAIAESLRKVLLLVDIYFSPEEFDLIPMRPEHSPYYFAGCKTSRQGMLRSEGIRASAEYCFNEARRHNKLIANEYGGSEVVPKSWNCAQIVPQ